MTRLLVIGDTLLDRDVVGRVERVCPDAPVPVVDVTAVNERPGGAGLAALLAVREGVEVVLATGLGEGRAGVRARSLLEGLVEVHDVRPGTPTVCKTRVRSRGQSLLRVDDDGALLGDEAHHVGEPVVDAGTLRRLLGACDAVLVSDYGGPLTSDPTIRALVEEHSAGTPIIWDPHPRGAEPVAGVAVATPNRAEAAHFAALHDLPGAADGTAGGTADVEAHAVALRRLWRAAAVCVTDGERGAVTVRSDEELLWTRAVSCPDGTDTCGAGDRFAASLAVSLAAGATTEVAVAEAQQDVGEWLLHGGVAALQPLGTTQPDSPIAPAEPRAPDEPAPERPEEPTPSRESDPDAPVTPDGPLVVHPARPASGAGGSAPTSGSVSLSADELVEAVRHRGGTVVATGGCFDVLHAGHLALLEQARSLGDCLVVLLNSDASVRRLKGASRPVHTVADRARLLEGLACVDAVAVFEDDDPTATLARLRPDVWVKGGDYREHDLPEARTVRALGGRIALVPYVDGHSTTKILEHIGASTSRTSTSTTTEGER